MKPEVGRDGGLSFEADPRWQLAQVCAPNTVPQGTLAGGAKVAARGRGAPVVVDEDRCSGCGVCIHACAKNALSVHGAAVVDLDRCTGCGVCVTECPNQALSLNLPGTR